MGSNLQNLANNNQVYKLQGEALKTWWRFWQQEPALPCIMFLATMPFGAALLIYMAVTGNKLTPPVVHGLGIVLSLAFLTWLVIGAILLSAANQHKKRSLLITMNDSGITFKSLFKQTLVPWHEISETFPTSTKEFVVCTKQGDFFFPQNMERADECFSAIKRKQQNRPENYDLALLRREGFNQASLLPIVSIMVAVNVSILRPLLSGIQPNALGVTIFLIGFNVLLLAGMRLLVSKVPSLLRVGPNGIFIRNSAGERLVSWNRITNIRNFGSDISILSADDQSYLLLWRAYLPPLFRSKGLFGHKEIKKQFEDRKAKGLELKNNFVQRAVLQSPQLKLIGKDSSNNRRK